MAFKRSAVRSRLSPPPKRERFSPLPFFLFMPRFARCIRRRTRRQRLSAPVPRLPPRPTRPKAARPPAKRRRSRHLCASAGMSLQRTAGGARRAVRPPSFPSPCGSSIPPAAVTPHAAKKFARRQRPFSRRYSLRAPLDDNHGSRRHDDGENACAGRRGAETPRSGRFLAPTIPAEPRFRMPVRSNAPRQNGRTQTACQKRIRLPAKHIKPKWIYEY